MLRRAAVLDRPNERSVALGPTPRGGGIAVIAGSLMAWFVLVAAGKKVPARLLARDRSGRRCSPAISWLDDLRGFAGCDAAGGAVRRRHCWDFSVGAGRRRYFRTGRPPPSAGAAAAVLWVWFVNLFNFMDGIDGIAGSEAAAIGIGLAAVRCGFRRGPGLDRRSLAAAAAAAALGFLLWNWPPARIFLGDVGSVPLGYLLGFLLLWAAARGHWRIA